MRDATSPGAKHDPARWLKRSNQMIASAAVSLAIGAFGFIIALVSLGQQYEAVRGRLVQMREARLASYSLLQASIDAETGQRGFLLTNNPRFLEPFETGRARALTALASLREATTGDPELAQGAARAEVLTREALSDLGETITLQRQGRLRPQLLARLDISKAKMDASRNHVGDVLADIERITETSRAAERGMRQALYWIGGLLGTLTLIAAALTMWALHVERRSWRAALDALTRANVAAEDARARAAASDLAKTRFLAVASHDMRQPLHALTLYLSALNKRVEGAEARDILSKMERATHSMVGMFAALLDLARIQAGVVKPEIESVALQEVIDRVLAEHVGANVETAPTSLLVRTDPILLQRVLSNLVGNAMKHGGGKVRIETRAAGGAVEIAVIDTGPGIAVEDQARIFEEFVRLDKSSVGSGLGLGLAIVQRIAGLLDLPLELHSAPGAGARFVVRPTLVRSVQALATRASDDAAPLAGASVLVMDDDALAREAVAGALRDLGADVQVCADGEGAEALLASGMRPRLLVMDFRIDGQLLGIAIANRLRARVDPPPQVIMITGDTGAETLEQLRASGHAWLIKPVDPRTLREAAAARLQAAQFASV